MKITVTVPGLLAASVGGARKFDVEASTLSEALDAIRRENSALRAHIWDESGKIRQHVLVYLNDESVTWIDDHASRKLKEGDQVHIIQAVSGG